MRKRAKLWEREVSMAAFMETGEEVDILETLAAEHTVEMVACSVEKRDMLMELVGCLNEKERVVFILHDIDGYKLREIAKYLGLKESTVRSIHSRTCHKLKHRAEELFGKEDYYD